MADPRLVTVDVVSRRWALLAALACLAPLLLQIQPRLAPGVAVIALLAPLLARHRTPPAWVSGLLAVAMLLAALAMHRFNFGRDTACAMLATMLALKPIEVRSLRDARALLGFALFAPFATFLLDQGPVSLVLGMAGAVLVLVAMNRLADVESHEGHAMRGWRRFAVVGRMIAIGLPVALATFWLFPRLSAPMWGVPERALARPGLSDRMAPGEWIDLIADDSPALRVTFDGPTPPRAQMYWRSIALWDFDGREWKAPEWSRVLPMPTVERGPVQYRYRIEVEPTDREQMVALDLADGAPPGLAIDRDYALRAPGPLSSLTRWTMTASKPQVFEPRLSPYMRSRALALPTGYNPRTLALARQWRAESGNDDAAIVRRSLAWIQREFVYTLETPLLGRDSVDEFLFQYKAGFCEHYSSAFVVLMRGAGIPARVVLGYTGGYRNPLGDYWLVRRSDAHAWAEVWLQGRGWVRVDPTAAVAPERIFDTIADRTPGTFGNFSGLAPVFNMGDWLRRGWNDFVLGFDATRQRRMFDNLGMPDVDPMRLAVMFIAAVGLALGLMLWLTTRQEREPDPVLRAWRRLERRYRRRGEGRDPDEPAAQWARRIAGDNPARAELLRLSARFSEWRYARDRGGAQDAGALIRDLLRHRPDSPGDRPA